MFNILNMYKKKTLFKKEAKPLACKREILPNGFFGADFDTQKWKNSYISNVNYMLVGPTISSTPLNPDNYESAQNARSKRQKYFCLCFDYEFQQGQEFVYLASSIPYPYTYLQKFIKNNTVLSKQSATLTKSLGGL